MISRLPIGGLHPFSLDSVVSGCCFEMQGSFFGFPGRNLSLQADELWDRRGFQYDDQLFHNEFSLPGWLPPFQQANEACPHQWAISLVLLGVQ